GCPDRVAVDEVDDLRRGLPAGRHGDSGAGHLRVGGQGMQDQRPVPLEPVVAPGVAGPQFHGDGPFAREVGSEPEQNHEVENLPSGEAECLDLERLVVDLGYVDLAGRRAAVARVGAFAALAGPQRYPEVVPLTTALEVLHAPPFATALVDPR